MKFICVMFSVLGAFFAALFASSCQSVNTSAVDAPREMICELRYAGSTYAPMQSEQPYNFALYDINGKFVAYLDTSRIVIPGFDKLMGQFVIVRGSMLKIDSESVFRADSIRKKR